MDPTKVKAELDRDASEVRGPSLKEQKMGNIVITHGWDEDDFVIHASTIHAKLRFKIGEQRLLHEIIGVLNKAIPETCRVDVFTPYEDWDIRVYTFKARGLKTYWQITDEVLEKVVMSLFTKLNSLV